MKLFEIHEGVVKVPPRLYHFTEAENAETILRDGLKPQASRYKSFPYPPRIFLLLDEADWFELEDAFDAQGRDMTHIVRFEIDTTKLKNIFHIDENLFLDDEVQSVWTDEAIPPEAIVSHHKL